MRLLLCLSCLFLTQFSFGQQLGVEVQGGLEIGWWIHNMGSTDPDIANNRGWARSYTDNSFSSQANILYKNKKTTIGVGIQYSWFFENDLRGNEDMVGNFDRVRIAPNETVHFLKYSFMAEYDLFSTPKVTILSPHIKFGSFVTNTIHPDVNRFGTHLFWELGANHSFHLKKMDIIILTKYSNAAIYPDTVIYFNEKHNITGIGLNVGIRYWVGRKS